MCFEKFQHWIEQQNHVVTGCIFHFFVNQCNIITHVLYERVAVRSFLHANDIEDIDIRVQQHCVQVQMGGLKGDRQHVLHHSVDALHQGLGREEELQQVAILRIVTTALRNEIHTRHIRLDGAPDVRGVHGEGSNVLHNGMCNHVLVAVHRHGDVGTRAQLLLEELHGQLLQVPLLQQRGENENDFFGGALHLLFGALKCLVQEAI